ncbi:MAG: hypothetical protein CMJ78_15265 [Planctomycetaceae bacterium]|nr:hypothetical protein [Planctomycetaceae bacterium]
MRFPITNREHRNHGPLVGSARVLMSLICIFGLVATLCVAQDAQPPSSDSAQPPAAQAEARADDAATTEAVANEEQESTQPNEGDETGKTEEAPAEEQPPEEKPKRKKKVPPIPIERLRYKTLVTIAFDQTPLMTARFREDVLNRYRQLASKVLGQMWDPVVEENQWLFPPTEVGVARITNEAAKERFEPLKYNKVYILSIQQNGTRFLVSGREWDRTTRELDVVQTATTSDRRNVSLAAFQLSRKLFRAVIQIDASDDRGVLFRMHGGEYLASDDAAEQLPTGTLLKPMYRYMDKKKVLQRVQFHPWTYVEVNTRNRGRGVGQVHSGLANALGAKLGRRIQLRAIAIKQFQPETTLLLRPRRNATKPLVGYNVLVHKEKPKRKRLPSEDEEEPVEEEPPPVPLTLLSDRNGAVIVPINPAQKMLWLEVRSGQTLLAKMPFVPGISDRERVDVTDDSLRLAVEGAVSILQGELIDTVARRAVLMALANKYAKNSKWDDVAEQLTQLDELEELRSFESRLEAIRFPAIEEAKRKRDRTAESRIRRMCKQTGDVIKRHLDDTKVADLKAELAELKRLDDLDAAENN